MYGKILYNIILFLTCLPIITRFPFFYQTGLYNTCSVNPLPFWRKQVNKTR